MSPVVTILLCALVYIVVLGLSVAYVARQKGRLEAEGYLFAILFGPLNLILVACLPKLEPVIQERTRCPGCYNVVQTVSMLNGLCQSCQPTPSAHEAKASEHLANLK